MYGACCQQKLDTDRENSARFGDRKQGMKMYLHGVVIKDNNIVG